LAADAPGGIAAEVGIDIFLAGGWPTAIPGFIAVDGGAIPILPALAIAEFVTSATHLID
jgi:hypothetical protein